MRGHGGTKEKAKLQDAEGSIGKRQTGGKGLNEN